MALTRSRLIAACTLLAIAFAAAGDRAGACGILDTIILVNIVRPADVVAFDRGSLGVVQPSYERRFLISAYRRLHGLDTVVDVPSGRTGAAGKREQPLGWLEARERVLKTGQKIDPWRFGTARPLPDYRSFENCGDEAFDTAADTLAARIRQHGEGAVQVADWIRAQDAVFGNCAGSGTELVVLPAPAPPDADALTRADRAYQSAAAHFYAMQYEEAERRFLVIAADETSPWRPYGRYLASRSMLRRESVGIPAVANADRATLFDNADRLLTAIETDASMPAGLRTSANGMRDLIALRARPAQRLGQLAALLAAKGSIRSQNLTDYLLGFDANVSPETEYDYDGLRDRERLVAGSDLTDWIIALQGSGAGAAKRAIARWSETRELHWLLAALWKVTPNEEAADALLRDAAAIDAASPAYATASFLRARLLIARGDRAGARRLLATLPDQPTTAVPSEAINLFRALRLQVAADLETWLRAAPRFSVTAGGSFSTSYALERPLDPTFDVDAALALTESFPLDRLVDASASAALPQRLRLIVAGEAWTRAVQLRRDEDGRRAATVLKQLAPELSEEMDRYLMAADADARHFAGVLTILRWPTFRNYVPLAEGATPGLVPRFTGPSQALNVYIRKSWWCGFGPMRTWVVSGPYEETPVTRLPQMVYQAGRIPPPAVVSAAERSRATREFEALASLGTAPNYLSREAMTWARTRPKDRDVPEALARAVTSTQYGCSDKETGAFSRQAFTILHRQYPGTEWAKRTKYWFSY